MAIRHEVCISIFYPFMGATRMDAIPHSITVQIPCPISTGWPPTLVSFDLQSNPVVGSLSRTLRSGPLLVGEILWPVRLGLLTETLCQCSDSVNLVAVYRSSCRSYFIVDNSDRRSGFSCQNPSGGEVPVWYPYTCILVQTLVTRHPHRIRLFDPTDMIPRFMYSVYS